MGLLARWCREAPDGEGTTFALTGAWGSGKTSVLNLLEAELAEDDFVVTRFEPWLFNSADDLVARYLNELAEQARDTPTERLSRLADPLSRYAAALSPLISTFAGPLGAAFELPRKLLETAPPSAIEVRNQLRDAFVESSVRIVVTVDDIDRLSPSETAEVLRLVKVVADFPGVIHILSFDHARTCEALESAGHANGQSYLEKIVQASVALPQVPPGVLRARVFEQVEAALGGRDLSAWDHEYWARLFDRGIEPHIANLRDGRRWATTVPYLLDLCDDEVCSMDLFALAALQAFEPVVHAGLSRIAGELTRTRDSWAYSSDGKEAADERARSAVDLLVAQADDPKATEALLRALFPAYDQLKGGYAAPDRQQDLALKRVASRQVLSRYLYAQIDKAEAASATVAAAVGALDDAARFRKIIEATEGERLDDLYGRMRLQLDDVRSADVVGVGTTILESIERIPTDGSRLVIGRERRPMWLLGELIAQVVTEPKRAEEVLALIEATSSLAHKVALLVAFRCPESREPRGVDDILRGDSLEMAVSDIVETAADASAEEVAQCEPLLWLIGWIAKQHGRASAANLMREPVIVESLLSQYGTELLPLSSGHDRIELAPLADAVAERGLAEIRRCLPKTSLRDEIQAAFNRAHDEWIARAREEAAEAHDTLGDGHRDGSAP